MDAKGIIIRQGLNPGLLGIIKPKLMVVPPPYIMSSLETALKYNIMPYDMYFGIVKRYIIIDTAIYQELESRGLYN